jgi:hypothetical protein
MCGEGKKNGNVWIQQEWFFKDIFSQRMCLYTLLTWKPKEIFNLLFSILNFLLNMTKIFKFFFETLFPYIDQASLELMVLLLKLQVCTTTPSTNILFQGYTFSRNVTQSQNYRQSLYLLTEFSWFLNCLIFPFLPLILLFLFPFFFFLLFQWIFCYIIGVSR